MTLTPEQKSAVSSWIAAGASIADVQRRLREEFQTSLTYMATRFLLDDLGLNLKETAKPAPAAPTIDADKAGRGTPPPLPGQGTAIPANAELIDDGDAYAAGEDEFADTPLDDAAAMPGGAGAGTVKVEVDRITRPGTVVSGAVTFSDGQAGKWGLDQLGRLVFEGNTPGYRPSPADLQTFQRELSQQLQRHGY